MPSFVHRRIKFPISHISQPWLASSSYYAHNLRIFSVNILRALAHFLAPPKILADFRDVENVDTNHLPRWTGGCKFRVIFSSLNHSLSLYLFLTHTHDLRDLSVCETSTRMSKIDNLTIRRKDV